jgi:hypothetical protein
MFPKKKMREEEERGASEGDRSPSPWAINKKASSR